MTLNNVPLTGQTLGQTKVPINGNFVSIDTAFAQDHVPYNTASGVSVASTGQGKHNRVTFPVQSASPPAVVAAGDDVLYNFLFPGTAKNELYIHKQTQAGVAEIPFTASSLSNVPPLNTQSGWTYLPSGILVKWVVNQSITSSGTHNYTISSPGPSFTNLFWVGITSAGATINTYSLVSIVSTTVLSINASSGSGMVNFLLIGR